MNVKLKRLALVIAAIAIVAGLLTGSAYAAPTTSGNDWIQGVDWEDPKEDETTTAAPTTAAPTTVAPTTAAPTTVAPTTAAPTTTASPPSDEQIDVSGKKIWEHGGNPLDKRPDSITVIVQADGVTVIQRLVTATDHWAWSFKLPKYDKDGKGIIYTVDEVRIEGYVKKVEGYNLTNVYMPGRNTDEPYPPDARPGGRPNTSDDSNLSLWLALMGASLVGMALIIIIPRRKRREKNRS